MKTRMESLTLPAPDKFTDRWLARVQLKPGTNVREVEAFEKGSGLGVRIRANGGKTLFAQKTKRGMKRWRQTLGPYPELTLTAARAAVEATVGKMASGVDVHQEHKDRIAKGKAPKPLTLAELTDRWDREGLAVQRGGYRRRATA